MSAAARLAPHGRTILLEAETAFGYHSSGRSATYYHFGIGKSVVRGMTAFSGTHFETHDFYMLPESGKLLACPVDEVPSMPGDAQPEEYDMALAAAKVEEYTSLSVRRIGQSWAGLRIFAVDRVPVAGFAPDAEGFFWLAGQGGYGLQTAPAMSAATEALVMDGAWPAGLADWGVTSKDLAPERLLPV